MFQFSVILIKFWQRKPEIKPTIHDNKYTRSNHKHRDTSGDIEFQKVLHTYI